MIFINWQIVRSARSILLNSDSAAWRFRTMLRSAMWTKQTSEMCAGAVTRMSRIYPKQTSAARCTTSAFRS